MVLEEMDVVSRPAILMMRTKASHPKETTSMKISKSQVQGKASPVATIRFEAQTLTSYAGLVIVQRFFAQLGLKQRLSNCFAHLGASPAYRQ